MIDLDFATGRGVKKGQVLVRLEGERPRPDRAKDAVESLLSARFSVPQHGWLISIDDLPYLDHALDALQVSEEAEISADLKAYADEHFDQRDALVALKSAPADFTLLDQMKGWKTKPFADQLQCLRFHIARMQVRRGSIEGGETGIGKSMTVLYTYLWWKSHGAADRGIIICMNTGKLDWEAQAKEHTTLNPFFLGNGTKEVLGDLDRFERSDSDLLIAHYDCIAANESVWKRFMAMKCFGFVALDEVHKLKNPKSIRHKRITAMLDKWPEAKIVAASGTAMDGNPKSAWAPIMITEARPGYYFPTRSDFERHFITWKEKFFYGRRVNVEDGVKNLGRLKDMLEPVCVRFLKKDVTGRESKIFQHRVVDLKGGQAKLYREVKEATLSQIQAEGSTFPLAQLETRLLRLRQILNHPLLLDSIVHFEGDSAKYVELDDVVEEVLSNPDAQILVWTQWREAVNMLVKRYKEYGAVAFYGGSDDREVRDIVVGKKARVVVAIPEKAGTSVDWLKVCRTAVYLEKPWDLTLYRQSLDRIDRRANTDFATIITIEAANSVDQVVNAVLTRRQNVFDALTIDDEKLVGMRKAELLEYLK